MRDIPPEILERIELVTEDQITRVKSIRPVKPCPCGAELTNTRIVRVNRAEFPFSHHREYCYTCKLVSILDENDWKPAAELNAEMRGAEFAKKRRISTELDK